MGSEHEKQIVMALTPYLVAFPQSKMTAEGLVIYAKALGGLSLGALNAAMMKLIKTSKFFPTIAEILEAAESLKQFASGQRLPTPAEAWAEVQHEAKRKYFYRPWELSCPEVEAAAKQFGKYELCTLKAEELGIARAQFTRIYDTIANRARDEAINREVLAALPLGEARGNLSILNANGKKTSARQRGK